MGRCFLHNKTLYKGEDKNVRIYPEDELPFSEYLPYLIPRLVFLSPFWDQESGAQRPTANLILPLKIFGTKGSSVWESGGTGRGVGGHAVRAGWGRGNSYFRPMC